MLSARNNDWSSSAELQLQKVATSQCSTAVSEAKEHLQLLQHVVNYWQEQQRDVVHSTFVSLYLPSVF